MSDLHYSKAISPNDHMWNTGADWYFEVGKSALTCIQRVLTLREESPQSILDLPCGHGRVCRMLRAAYPAAHLTVCDLDRDGVDFCSASFGATGVYAEESPQQVRIDRKFDLIWCGSLFTHLEDGRWPAFLEFFHDHLAPDGILVFTTHGRQVIQWMIDGVYSYGLTPGEQRTLMAGYAARGFGFVSPVKQPLGISLSSAAFVCSEVLKWPALKLITYHEAGWAGHQDVVCCLRLRRGFPTLDTATLGLSHAIAALPAP